MKVILDKLNVKLTEFIIDVRHSNAIKADRSSRNGKVFEGSGASLDLANSKLDLPFCLIYAHMP